MPTNQRRPVIIAVAPVGKQVAPPSRNPLIPAEVAAEVLACAQAGASMVHLHVRDAQGTQTEDLTAFAQTLDLICAGSDIIIQGSTGGVTTLSREDRCVSLNDPRVEVASLNMGSANVGEGVYVNTLPDIRFWAQRMQERQIVPELELFEAGMLTNIPRLVQDGLLAPPFHLNFCVGFEGPLPADATSLFFLRSMLPAGDVLWGVIHEGMTHLGLLAAALGMGATLVRVGFEDGAFLAPGEPALTNADLVIRLVDVVQRLGYQVATPAEARNLLHIPKR